MKVSSAIVTASALGMGLFLMSGFGFSSERGMNDKTGSKMDFSMEEPMATMNVEPTPSSEKKGHDEVMNSKMENGMNHGMKTDKPAKPVKPGMKDDKKGAPQMPTQEATEMMQQ